MKPWLSVRDKAVIKEILSWWDMSVYEYGCGGSTIYFKDKCKIWCAVEHNTEWYNKIIEAGGNVTLQTDMLEYIQMPHYDYDLVIVDGIYREFCLDTVRKKLKNSALILCHDARRRQYMPHVNAYKWNMRIGDDLFIMSNSQPSESIINSLKKYELRDVNTQSYAWDASHTFGQKLAKCGLQY